MRTFILTMKRSADPRSPSTPPISYTLRIDDDGRGELEVHATEPRPPLRVAIPARCTRLLLALLFVEITDAVTPRASDPRPSWRRGRPTLAGLAALLAILDGHSVPIHAEGVGTYIRTLNAKIARAAARAWPGHSVAPLVQQRQGGRLAATLRVPGLGQVPMSPILQAYVDRYVKALADPSLADAVRARLKGYSTDEATP